jgi:hypothetical protein
LDQIKQHNFFEAKKEQDGISFVRIELDIYCPEEIDKKLAEIETLKT